MELKRLSYLVLCTCYPVHDAAAAEQEQEQKLAQVTMPVVVIESTRARPAPGLPTAGSRLGLTLLETPAAVEVLSSAQIEARGARSLDEALRGAVGLTQGGNPTSPSQTSSRGFASGFVSYLYDGSRVSVPTMSARTQDTFNIERIEILKGPASVIHGDGAIGGAVNFVTRRPDPRRPAGEALLSFGSAGSWRAGAGWNQPLGAHSAVRIDYSRQQSDGYVERNEQRYDNLNMAFRSQLTRAITVELSVALLSDDISAYQGTPLVPRSFAAQPDNAVVDAAGRVIDRRLAFSNFNTADAMMKAQSSWTRARLAWQLAPQWKLSNELSYYSADRTWQNAESYVFAAPAQLIRDLVGVTHDHQVWSNRLELAYAGSLAGMKHRVSAGVEYNKTSFATGRRFSNGSAAANRALGVDILAPVPGSYAALSEQADLYTGAGNRTSFSTSIPTVALFAEDALSLTSKWTLVAGLRQDRVRLERANLDLNSGTRTAYSQRYEPRSVRIGAVYALDQHSALYAQHTNASAPVGSGNLLLLSAANTAFDLSKGTQSEVGVKRTLMDGALDYSVALYRIELDNILSRDAAVPTLTVNNGKQSSRGIELAAGWRPTRQLAISGNAAFVDAQFDRLIEAGQVSRAGNVPPNVAKKMANLWLDYRFAQLPLKVGAAIHHSGDRYSNNANTINLRAYTTADAYAAWPLGQGELTLRVRNLNDALYAAWTGANANSQVIMGAPRSVDLTYRTRF